jgi:hypothetical protein
MAVVPDNETEVKRIFVDGERTSFVPESIMIIARPFKAGNNAMGLEYSSSPG